MNTRYLVLLHLGRYEDQELSCLPLVLIAPASGEPRTVLEKLVRDLKSVYSEVCDYPESCPNDKCVNFGRFCGGDFCSKCGTKLAKGEDFDEEGFRRFVGDIFHATCDSVSQETIDGLKGRGWGMFAQDYNPDVIVRISGVRDYLDDPEFWHDDYGKLEVLHA